MFCCSAAGDMLPPMVVYKAANGVTYRTWTERGPAGIVYDATKSGWFNMQMFNRWFVEVKKFFFLSIKYRYQ